MIQRIQSVYMLVATMLGVLCLCMPVGRLTMTDGLGTLTNLKLTLTTGESSNSPWALFAILLFSTVLNGITIFAYRNRIWQMRTLVVAILFLIGYYAFFAFYVWVIANSLSFRPTLTSSFPLIIIVLDYLAFRRVLKDEMLVRSLDRLR
ncbi:MAG: DUF4293 domain-containing protein [Bacteroidaceae bacterium]|nr:DUF4293 domain-containing protein [Bacteroidaceae bacterium]MDE6159022.1 DUF4293 domain-containing protein [Bacteroidaceae bacterium]